MTKSTCRRKSADSQPWADSVRELRVQVEEIADMLGPLDACRPIETYTVKGFGEVGDEHRRCWYDGAMGKVVTIDEEPGFVFLTCSQLVIDDSDMVAMSPSHIRDYAAALLSAARYARTVGVMRGADT
ncbi:hypothetical protein GCM10009785_00120 [Brooklawnia cerclae]|uniref:Uncharacterized protein n=1 Tax=Brooklawnia cerclae TaxID=349934 RepID=A0ABX0SMD9_9ACTN|nr:hypothetical protein [Brooklawnia cerclae]NIH58493.1 hypothetical protein [Brooklawnia cerclae]